MAKEVHGFLWGILAAITGACMALFVKLANEVPITTLVFIRFFLAIPIIVVLLFRKKVHFSWEKLPKHLTRSLAGLGALYCYYFALRHLDLVNAVTLRNTSPLFMPILAFFWWKIMISKRRIIALSVGFFGVLVLMQPSENFIKIGSLFAVLSAFLGAIAMLSIRQLSKSEPIEVILSYYFAICSVITIVPMIFGYKHIQDPIQWVYLLAAGFSALIFQYTITKAYTHSPATKVSTVNYLGVFFGGLYGWFFFDEIPNIWVWIGAIFIVIGAIIALTDPSKPRHLKKG